MGRVESVEAIPVGYAEPNDHNAQRFLCLVRIEDSDGRVGWGESITQFEEATFAAKAVIDGVAELVIGTDPLHKTVVWRAIKDRAWWYGYGGGIASYAVAAIDIALWDLAGKQLGKPVLDLLGGPVHERLPAIASAHAHKESIPAMVEEAQGWLEGGLQGMKVGFGKRGNARLGYELDRDVEYVAAMRSGLGADAMLMVDCGIAVKWSVPDAVKRVRAFEDHGLEWIEEPLGAWDPPGYRTLRQQTSTQIAYGEKEWNVAGYERVLATDTVDVVGIDPARAEGITGFRLVADRCEAYQRRCNAHAWSSAICTAASLALSFSTPSSYVFEVKPLSNPMQDELVVEPISHVDGWMYPLEGDGLGVEIREDVVDRYRLG